jgi:putative transposase
MSDIPYCCARSRTCCPSVASTFVMRRCGSGGTGSVRCPPPRYGQPRVIVTDRLRSYRAAMNVIGVAADQTCGRWLNNRAENSHQPFRRGEGVMSKFRDVKTLQKFASIHASIHNHFNLERHLNHRNKFEQDRAATLAEWRQLAA